MKKPKHFLNKCATVATLYGILSSSSLLAEAVDTELIIMVDVSGSFSDNDFEFQKQVYADIFRSQDIMDAIFEGSENKLAVSMVVFSGKSQQFTAVEWMKIYDSASANAFADAILSSNRQYSGQTAIGEALDYATQSFGNETNNPGNGYESLYQIIQITGDGIDNATGPRRFDQEQNVKDARDAAKAAGVDLIEAVTWEHDCPDLNVYYEENVISSNLTGRPGTVRRYDEGDNLETILKDQVVQAITRTSTSSVPEPSSTVMILIGSLGLLIRRNK